MDDGSNAIISGLAALPGGGAAELRSAFMIRAVEERLLGLFREGRVGGTIHTCVGQEFVGVAVGRVLRQDDMILSNHRGHGHFLGRTGDVEGLIAEVMGRRSGASGGMGGTQHLFGDGFLSNGILAGMSPIAAGIAFAQKRAGKGAIAVLFIGDGAMAEGLIYEAMNFASIRGVPLYIVCEHNGVAQSTRTDSVLAGSLSARGAAFGIAIRQSCTADPGQLCLDVAEAVAQVRDRGEPLFHLVETARLNAHSKGDDDRPADEIARLRQSDPLTILAASGDPAVKAAEEAARVRVEQAVEAAKAAAPATVRAVAPMIFQQPVRWAPARLLDGRLIDRLHGGLAAAMQRSSRVLLLGEDIEGPYGGAFKATRDLSLRHPGRVCNMPISEAAIIGVGTGLALRGERPCVEIMFGDFMTLCLDQLLNHAAKFGFMYGRELPVPLTVRTPMGARRGYGPTHSQTVEKHFLGIPGLAVLSMHYRADAEKLYARLLTEGDGVRLVVENKEAYQLDSARPRVAAYDYFESDEDWPTLLIRPPAPPDVTIVCHGGMLAYAEEAANLLLDEDEIVAEIVCPTSLCPLNLTPIAESASRSGRLLLVDEGVGFGNYAAEIMAGIVESLNFPPRMRRLSAAPHPIPAALDAEARQLPDAAAIRRNAKEMLS